MKTTKKLVALILAILTAFSFTSLAFAEEDTYDVYPNYVKEIKVAAKDDDKVTQVQFVFANSQIDAGNAENANLVDFNAFDANAVIKVYFNCIIYNNEVAQLKPTSYSNFTLTCDVYDGSDKGVEFVSFNDYGLSYFYYEIDSQDFLKYVNGEGEVVSSICNLEDDFVLADLETVDVLPKSVSKVIAKLVEGEDIISAITSALPLIGILPILLVITLIKVNKAYKPYGVKIGLSTIKEIVSELTGLF